MLQSHSSRIDLHCHILPGLDDGAPDMEAALQMGRELVAAGYSVVATSPHHGEGPGGDVGFLAQQAVRAQLTEAFAQAGIALKLLPNAEHHLTPGLLQRIEKAEAGGLVGIGSEDGSTRWLLVELPWQRVPHLDVLLFRLQAFGYRILLAHPERMRHIDLATWQSFVRRGCRMQLDLGSVVGRYGKRAQTQARALFAEGLVHVVGTDLHRPQASKPWLGRAFEMLQQWVGAEGLMQLTEVHPKKILEGEPPDAFEGIPLWVNGCVLANG